MTRNNTIPEPSNLLTIHEVAQILRVDDTTVRRWINGGGLDAVRLPHAGKRHGYRIRKETLDHAIETGSFAGE